MEPKISVIIPIYQVEKYLERAIQSVLDQTYPNLEIVLVDDGSKDRCGEICDQFAEQFPQIKVLHKENGGLSDARNAGLEIASGEWIAFLDSDDYYAKDFLSTLYIAAMETDSQVAICAYKVVKDFEQLDEEEPGDFLPDYQVYSREELLWNMYDSIHPQATYFIVAWNKLYHSSLWKDVRFPTGKIHEDEATTYKIYDLTTQGVYIKRQYYGYYEAPESITRNQFSLKRLEWMEALTNRIDYFHKNQRIALALLAQKARADASIRYYYRVSQKDLESFEAKKLLRSYVEQAVHQKMPSHEDDHEQEVLKVYSMLRKSKSGYRLFLKVPGLYKKYLQIVWGEFK